VLLSEPAGIMAKEIATAGPGQVRALFVSAGNPVLSVPNGEELVEAMKGLELSVGIDLYVNETTAHCDYVLPATTMYERDDFPLPFQILQPTPFRQATEAVVAPAGQAREEWAIIDELSRRLASRTPALRALQITRKALGLFGVRLTPRLVADAVIRLGAGGDRFGLNRGGLTFRRLTQQHPHGVVLAPNLKAGVLPTVVVYRGAKMRLVHDGISAEIAALGRRTDPDGYPLRLIGMRELRSENSWMHNVPLLMRGDRTQTALMHVDDAADLKLNDGDQGHRRRRHRDPARLGTQRRGWLAHRQRRGRRQRQPVDVERAGGSRTPRGDGPVDRCAGRRAPGLRLAPFREQTRTPPNVRSFGGFYVCSREKSGGLRYRLPDRQRGGGWVLSNWRVRWGTAALFLGLGAALLAGAGVASADSAGKHADNAHASSSSGNTAGTAAAGKHRAAPAAAAPAKRSIRAQDPAPTATALDPTEVTTVEASRPIRVAPHVAALRRLAAPVAHAPPTPVAASLVPTSTAVITPPDTNGVTGVKTGKSTLTIPAGSTSYNAPATWYFPTQADGTVAANGVIWLQHGFLANNSYYSSLATTLAQQTNSIVVVPTVPSFPSLRCPGCTLYGVPLQQGAASMFTGDEANLNISANQAGYQGTLPLDFVLAGHSAGGGWSVGVGGYYADSLAPGDPNHLLGVVMYDGVVMNGTMAQSIASLDKPAIPVPVYQIAAPAQQFNAFGITTDELAVLRPNQFIGDVLVNGSHVDSMLGSNPLVDFSAQLVTKFSPKGNTEAVYTLSAGWINDFYSGGTPATPKYGLYGSAGQPIILGEAAAAVLPSPIADQLGPIAQVMKAFTAKLLPWIFGSSSG
jgi:hypothetical protein